MKLTFDRAEMQKIAQKLCKVLARNKLAQKGILLQCDADNFEVTLTATSNGAEATQVMQAAVEESGSAVIDGEFLANLLSKFKGSTVRLVVLEDNVAIFRCENATFQIMATSAQSFLLFNKEKAIFSTEIEDLTSLIKNTVNIVSKEGEESSPLKSVKLSFNQHLIKALATDSQKLFLASKASAQGHKDFSVLIPAHFLKLLTSLMKDQPNVLVDVSKKTTTFKGGDMTFICRTAEGNFPQVESVISNFKGCYEAMINAKDLKEHLSSAAVIAGSNSAIHIVLSLLGISISCVGENGEFKSSIVASVTSPTPPEGFYYSTKSLLEGIGFLEGEVTFALDSNGILMASNGTDIFLQMPYRKPPAKAAKKEKTKKIKTTAAKAA